MTGAAAAPFCPCRPPHRPRSMPQSSHPLRPRSHPLKPPSPTSRTRSHRPHQRALPSLTSRRASLRTAAAATPPRCALLDELLGTRDAGGTVYGVPRAEARSPRARGSAAAAARRSWRQLRHPPPRPSSPGGRNVDVGPPRERSRWSWRPPRPQPSSTGDGEPTEASAADSVATELQPPSTTGSETLPSSSSPTLVDSVTPRFVELVGYQGALSARVNALEAGVESFAGLRRAADALAAQAWSERRTPTRTPCFDAPSQEAGTLCSCAGPLSRTSPTRMRSPAFLLCRGHSPARTRRRRSTERWRCRLRTRRSRPPSRTRRRSR